MTWRPDPGMTPNQIKKELNRQRRVTWEFSPVTKAVESKKLYNRKKNSYDRHIMITA